MRAGEGDSVFSLEMSQFKSASIYFRRIKMLIYEAMAEVCCQCTVVLHEQLDSTSSIYRKMASTLIN